MSVSLDANHRLGHPLPNKLVIVRSLPGLGDFLCVVPALRALRTALPEAQITLVGLPQVRPIGQRFRHYIQDWLEFPGYPGIPEVPLNPPQVAAFLAQVQALKFDLALQLHGNGSWMNGFTLLLGAMRSAGFFPSGQFCPDAEHFLPYPEHEPEIRRHLQLLEFLGIPAQGEHLEFPLWPSDWHEFTAIAHTYQLSPANYICIHPGASTADRRWAYPHFAKTADQLAAQGFQIVLTGTRSEANLTQAVAKAMQYPAIDLAGQTSLGGLAALLKTARLLICNDTGISHLAAALKTPSVVIFSNSELHRWAPLDRHRHRVIQNASSPLSTWHRSSKSIADWQSAVVEQVITEAFQLLHQREEVTYAS